MRLSTALPFFNALILVYLLPAISALTLTNFQQISGFNTACTNAYNTPLTDCSTSDFAGQGCSAKCIGFLDDLTTTLLYACSGTSVYPNTLIGLFFHNEGVQTLCSNAGNRTSSSDGGDESGQSGGQSGSYSGGVQSAAGDTSTSTTSTSTSTSTTSSIPQAAATSSTTTTSTSSTPQAAATSSTTTIVPTTVTPEPTTTTVAVVGTTITPDSPSDASTSTSHTKSSSSSPSTSTSTSNGNGGGTPLDIESSACHGAALTVWLFALLAGSAGAIWLL